MEFNKPIIEPDIGEGVKKSLVKVISDPTAVLNLSQHELWITRSYESYIII